MQKQAALDAKLVKMETESERNITALKIAGLEDLVKRQTVQLEALTKQLSAAQAQVQAMAVKAIEGARLLLTLMPGPSNSARRGRKVLVEDLRSVEPVEFC